MSKIGVLGSINMDLVVQVPRFLQPGETLAGSFFFDSYGGKGANQAVALAKLGASISMLGMVGDDSNGTRYTEYLKSLNMDSTYIQTKTNIPTGVAVITVTNEGHNHIAIVPGANFLVDNNYVDMCKNVISNLDYLLLQLEIPINTVEYAICLAKKHNVQTILDPAPAMPLSYDLYQAIDYITPNETETEILTGKKINHIDDIRAAAKFFLDKGVKNVIMKFGKNGAYAFNHNASYFVPSFLVTVVDTTAAGDTFNAAFTYALSTGQILADAVCFANAAAAIKITGLGAQKSMPNNIKKIEDLMMTQSMIKPVII